MRKAFLRTNLKNLRNSIPLERRQAAASQLAQLNVTGNVLSFASFGSEIDTQFLNQKLARENRLILPKVIGDELHLLHVDDLSKISLSKWGVPEPILSLCRPAEKIDTILVPGLAFDKDHFRLGYGKGHYDRLLSKISALTIGVGFIEQLAEKLPREPHDQSVDRLFLV
jgi:5-formyltetrahydrofolate cyclo-ligase